MPRNVLSAAVGFLDTADVDAAHYVEELRRRIADLEQEKSQLQEQRREFEEWKQKELDQITAQHKEEIAKVEQKLERIVQEMSDRAARELDNVKDESAKKAFQKKLTNVKAQANRELVREKEKVNPVVSPTAGQCSTTAAAGRRRQSGSRPVAIRNGKNHVHPG